MRDTGVGISESDQDVIFKRFRQARESLIRHQGGTGLGLAISQHIVGLLGGLIWVESSPGNGAVFYFTIPYKPVTQKSTGGLHKQSDYPMLFDWSSKTMLVVDNVDSGFNYMKAALSRTGINLLRADDSKAGIELCERNRMIDLVFIDVNTPGVSGYEATREIKRIRPLLPVILQITGALQGEPELCSQAGCDDYVSGPVKFNVLMNILSKHLDNHQ